MLVEEFDVAIVDTFGDFLADLMRSSSFDHVESGPSVLCLCSRRCTHKEVVLELSLESILFHMVGQGRWDFPVELGQRVAMIAAWDQNNSSTYFGYPTPVKPDQPMYEP